MTTKPKKVTHSEEMAYQTQVLILNSIFRRHGICDKIISEFIWKTGYTPAFSV